MLNKKIIILVSSLVCCSLAAVFYFKKHKTQNQKNPLKIEQPIVKDLVQYVNSSGTLRARDQISIGSLVAGRVLEFRADDNDIVKKNQILAVLDNGVGDSSVKNLQGQVEENQARLIYQQQFYARQQKLFESGQLSKNLFDQYTQDLAVAKAKVTQTKASLELETKTYNNLFIRSPDDGIVVARRVELGQMIPSQLNPIILFDIAKNLTAMEAYIDVDEADIGMVKTGQDVLFSVDAFPKLKFSAKVKRIQYLAKIVDNVVTYATVLDVANPDLCLRPGMTTNVDIKVAQALQGLSVPNRALRINAIALEKAAQALGYSFEKLESTALAVKVGKPGKAPIEYLWVLDKHKHVRQVEVHLGVSDGKWTQVLKGINNTTQVITEVDEVIENVLLKGMFGGGGGIGK